MLPITSHASLPNRRTLDDLRIKDDYLRDVLEGRAHLLFDGGMGTMLQARGLAGNGPAELLCLTNPDAVTDIQREYVEAGSQVITTNTFGANARTFAGAVLPDGSPVTVDAVFAAAIECARNAGARYVAADVGPTGTLLEPLGTLTFDEAYELFAEQTRAAETHGADLITIETMANLLEMRAAVLAAKETTSLPIFATMTFDETGRTFLGTTPTIAAAMLSSLGVQALGINCSLGPEALVPLVDELLAVSPCPVIVQPNAGLPQMVGGVVTYAVRPDDFVTAARPMITAGAGILGGCCGTNPDYIRLLAAELVEAEPPVRTPSGLRVLTSSQRLVAFPDLDAITINDSIDARSNEELQAALLEEDYDFVQGEALDAMDDEPDMLFVNAAAPAVDETKALREVVKQVQSVCPLPLQIGSANPEALEAAVRSYAGKPLIGPLADDGKAFTNMLALAAHYGCAVLVSTCRDTDSPPTDEEKSAAAERILATAATFGIPRYNVYVN